MSKLFIYGCSHSTNHNIPQESFWGYLLSKKLKLELSFKYRACPGRGLGHERVMDRVAIEGDQPH